MLVADEIRLRYPLQWGFRGETSLQYLGVSGGRAVLRERPGGGLELPIEEAAELHLFGPGAMTDLARLRFGDYVGVAVDDVVLYYETPRSQGRAELIGRHAGMTSREMRVPLMLV